MTGTPAYAPTEELLAQHGDVETGAGLVNLAVNVRADAPPPWLRRRLGGVDLAKYPNPAAARAAVAARHGRSVAQVLLTAGAAEAFVLIARATTPRHAVIVHPQFTEPEIALRTAGHDVHRIVLEAPFTLTPDAVPDDADLVIIGNPTNPTSVLHPSGVLRALARPGRLLVIDEAFADCVPGEPDSLAACDEVPGLVVIRSLTKTWGLAGLRAGYLLAEPTVVAAMARAQPPWAVSAPALDACVACSSAEAVAEATAWAQRLLVERAHLVQSLERIGGVRVVAAPSASFVLVHLDVSDARAALRAKGFAVRRGDTFPGLGPQWVRIAVRDPLTTTALANAVKEILCQTSTT
ncbi:MAG: Rv2231c family pyridoxal phosphate-dependent protein CobC [Actinomycetota bacterium]|nr:Rv2231c family pyridoxal phosphate-dependent protein CobC [Actinomycetota bacterium]